MQHLSCVWDLHCSSWQRWVLNQLSEDRDPTSIWIFMDTGGVLNPLGHKGNSAYQIYLQIFSPILCTGFSLSPPTPPHFLGPHPRHLEVPRLGVESELQLSAYTTATATQDPSCIGNLHPAQGNARSLTRWAGQGSNLCPHGHESTGTPAFCFLNGVFWSAKLLNFDKVWFIYFSFVAYDFGIISNTHLPNSDHEDSPLCCYLIVFLDPF